MPKSKLITKTMGPKKDVAIKRQASHYRFIHDIITLSATLGATELKFGSLHVRYGPESQTLAIGLTENETQKKTYQKTSAPPESGQPQTLSVLDQEVLDEMELNQMMVEDPLSFENAMIAAHLEGAENARTNFAEDR